MCEWKDFRCDQRESKERSEVKGMKHKGRLFEIIWMTVCRLWCDYLYCVGDVVEDLVGRHGMPGRK